MHEMGIILEVIDIVQASLPAGSFNADVRRIRLKVGQLSAVVPATLQFCFGVAAKEAGLDQAELLIEEIAVQARCKDCAHNWTIDTPAFICPECSSVRIELLSGRELDIDSIEIAEDTPPHADPSS
jgi:hydrogenase nickel incorporation protein HypA/HybF